MSTIILVRHGQAVPSLDHYDQLTPLGVKQAERLGRAWVENDVTLDRVVVGPRLRHRQTAEAVAKAYQRAGKPFPKLEELPGLDEFAALELMKRAPPDSVDSIGHSAVGWERGDAEAKRRVEHRFKQVITLYVQGEIAYPDIEPFSAFREGVESALSELTGACGPGVTVAGFTSGGPIGAAVGLALDLSHEKLLETMWMIRNTSVSEFRFAQGAFQLASFNSTPHLDTSELLTYL